MDLALQLLTGTKGWYFEGNGICNFLQLSDFSKQVRSEATVGKTSSSGT